ncbi:MAG: hypothetical protein R6X06_08290 [Gammaproteobacteria bacterium]
MQTQHTYIDFNNFEALAQQQDILNSLTSNYCRIFGEPDVWNETYDHDEIREKLQQELSGTSALRVCLDTESNEVIGFCWAQLLDAAEIVTAVQSVHFYTAYGAPDVDQALHNIIGKNAVIYVQDLGINKAYRGSIPLEQLICPVIENVSKRAQTRNVFFWSVADTCIGWLAEKTGIRTALTIGKMQFFGGEFPEPEFIQSLVK